MAVLRGGRPSSKTPCPPSYDSYLIYFHICTSRPLIDWDLILVMEPPTLFGALVGANLNKVLSETIIAVMLVILLSFTACTTFKKAVKMYRLESVQRAENAEPLLNRYLDEELSDGHDREEDGPFEYEEFCLDRPSFVGVQPIQLDGPETTLFYNPISNHDREEDSDELQSPEFDNPLLLENIMEQERHVKKGNVALLIVLFSVVIIVNILKGGGGYPSPIGINCGSIAFWMAQLLLLLFIVAMSLVARRRLIRDTQRKVDAGYRYLKEDIRWDERSTVVYPLVSSVAGFCAGN